MMKRHRMNEPWFSDVFCVLHGAPCSTPPLSGKGALPVSSSGSIRMTCGIFTSYLGSFAVLLGKAAKYLRIIKPKKMGVPETKWYYTQLLHVSADGFSGKMMIQKGHAQDHFHDHLSRENYDHRGTQLSEKPTCFGVVALMLHKGINRVYLVVYLMGCLRAGCAVCGFSWSPRKHSKMIISDVHASRSKIDIFLQLNQLFFHNIPCFFQHSTWSNQVIYIYIYIYNYILYIYIIYYMLYVYILYIIYYILYIIYYILYIIYYILYTIYYIIYIIYIYIIYYIFYIAELPHIFFSRQTPYVTRAAAAAWRHQSYHSEAPAKRDVLIFFLDQLTYVKCDVYYYSISNISIVLYRI